MRRALESMLHSLSARLIVRLVVIVAVVFAVYAAVSLRTTERQWGALMRSCTSRTSELVERATHYGMLLNRKEEVHHTIRQIASSPGVSGIRIYDKQGNIMFSANPAEIGHQVDMQASACVICHKESGEISAPSSPDQARIFRTPQGERIFGFINPIENKPECSNAACHAHPPDQTVLGVLDVQMSLGFADQSLENTQRQLAWTAAILALVLGLAVVLFVYRMVRRPVRHLYEGTQHIAAGDLDTRIQVETDDELGHLGLAFNHMAEDLGRARAQLTAWSHQLEEKVARKTEELGRAQRQMLQMDKMASLGKLAATVAHELNNPLAGILTYAKLVDREVEDGGPAAEERDEVRRYLDVIQKESARCGNIVRNLLVFARGSGAEMAPLHVNEALERSAMLVRHHLEMAGARMELEPMAGNDEIVADVDQLQQALLALLVNAVEAMAGREGERLLCLRARGDDEAVTIEVSDTGVGIPEDVLPHIFEPFVSTKTKESGVGLGLAVVFGIVQRHNGTIDVDSQAGVGTTFRMRLPRRPGGQGGAPARDAGPGSKRTERA